MSVRGYRERERERPYVCVCVRVCATQLWWNKKVKEVDLQKIRTEIEYRGYDHKELHLNQKKFNRNKTS